MKEYFLKIAAKLLANTVDKASAGVKDFTMSDIDTIVAFVIKESKENKEGIEKANAVIAKFSEKWAGRAAWVESTVVKICFAIAKLRNINL